MEDVITLAFLVLLQLVLGFDNLLYISLESKRVRADRQASVRRWGIGIAILFRIVLLFVVIDLVDRFEDPLFGNRDTERVEGEFNLVDYLEGEFNLHSLIVLLGGGFILYTAMKEIYHMMRIEADKHHAARKQRSVVTAIIWIVLMNAVFSFDSILSAMALTNVFWVMATAIVISGAMMIWLADRVSVFLERNRMYEVLGLFILFIVGIMLITEGGHLAHLHLFGNPITPMTKTTFYFVIGVLVVTDIVQSRYQNKLMQSKID